MTIWELKYLNIIIRMKVCHKFRSFCLNVRYVTYGKGKDHFMSMTNFKCIYQAYRDCAVAHTASNFIPVRLTAYFLLWFTEPWPQSDGSNQWTMSRSLVNHNENYAYFFYVVLCFNMIRYTTVYAYWTVQSLY